MDTESMSNYHAREAAPYRSAIIAAKILTGRKIKELTDDEFKLVEQLVIGEFLTETDEHFVGDLCETHFSD